MVECQLKGVFYNFDYKYFPGNKCKWNKHFMDISEDVYDDYFDVSPVEEIPQLYDTLVNPLIHLKLGHSFCCMPWLDSLLFKTSN